MNCSERRGRQLLRQSIYIIPISLFLSSFPRDYGMPCVCLVCAEYLSWVTYTRNDIFSRALQAAFDLSYTDARRYRALDFVGAMRKLFVEWDTSLCRLVFRYLARARSALCSRQSC